MSTKAWTSIGPADLTDAVIVHGCKLCGADAVHGEPIHHAPTCAERTRILDADGNEIGPLPQRDMVPPIRVDETMTGIRAALLAIVIDQPGAEDLSSVRAATAEQRALARAEITIAALRAALAPLLDDPYEMHDIELSDESSGDPLWRCRFCQVEPVWKRAWTGRRDARGRKINEDVDATPHNPDCAVLRRDELLGRS